MSTVQWVHLYGSYKLSSSRMKWNQEQLLWWYNPSCQGSRERMKVGNMQFKIFLAVVFPDGNQGEVLAWHLLPPQETTTQHSLRLYSMKGGAVELLAAAGLGPVPILNDLLQRIRTSPGTGWAVVLGWCLVQGQEWTRLNHLLNTSSMNGSKK